MLGRLIKDLIRRPSPSPVKEAVQLPVHETREYRPDVFDAPDLQAAKAIILTPEDGLSTEQRWQTETAYLAGVIGKALSLDASKLVLDYGCGIGRVSKALIEQHGCRVLGVDISTAMRGLAPGYVGNDAFSTLSPTVLRAMTANGMKADCGMAIWVLQHCPAVRDDIALIKSVLKKNGLFFVLNNNTAAVPSDKGWVNDGTDVRAILEQEFTVVRFSRLPVHAATSYIAENTFIAECRNDK